MQANPLYIGIFVSSMLFPALASIIKEKIFSEAKEKLEGQPLDIFVVNSFGSAAQALGVLLLLPVLVSSRGLSLTELPQYVSDGKLHVVCHFLHLALSRAVSSAQGSSVAIMSQCDMAITDAAADVTPGHLHCCCCCCYLPLFLWLSLASFDCGGAVVGASVYRCPCLWPSDVPVA